MEREFISWSDDLSVGIQELDEQHKVLFNLINRLFNEAFIMRNASVASEVLTELVQYTIIHFAVEESLFRIFNYPAYEGHKAQHAELTSQVMALKDRVEHGEEINAELLSFLRGWLKKHIVQEDKRYTGFFAEKGMQKNWAKKSWLGKIWK
ncbi:MAG: hemerythrin [Candidatus Parabeggiatoa sp. nov. 3]|nr:MAG: hemerythrin [Gammaproteobacteria bacterium]RKZ69438.1 MAG: hemerythrin [Gammaproteobacteria bacterium]RKZ80139.1 MAG: hemerythrin [Gammaproteobacteria bacterium]